ncbi:MAG: hypothetical protein AB8H12_10570 [Lewinella sp.]
MYLVLKEMKIWVEFLFDTDGVLEDDYAAKDSRYFDQFYTWLNSRRTLFSEHALSEYLEPVISIFIRVVSAKKLYDMNQNSSSVFGKLGRIASQGGMIALMPEFVKQRKMLDGLIDIFANQLRERLADGDVDFVFKSLQADVKNCDNSQIVNGFYAIKKRYNDLQFQQMQGIISHDNFFLESNRIGNSLLSFI